MFLLEYTLTLDVDLPFLQSMLLPKLSTVDLENASPTMMPFHAALFLVKELTLQQIKCSHGPIPIQFTGFTMVPTILKKPA